MEVGILFGSRAVRVSSAGASQVWFPTWDLYYPLTVFSMPSFTPFRDIGDNFVLPASKRLLISPSLSLLNSLIATNRYRTLRLHIIICNMEVPIPTDKNDIGNGVMLRSVHGSTACGQFHEACLVTIWWGRTFAITLHFFFSRLSSLLLLHCTAIP